MPSNRFLRGTQRRRAVTLIEAVLFISIALGLIVGGIVFYQQASLAAKTQRHIRELSSLIQEARVLYHGVTAIDFFDADPTQLAHMYSSGTRIDDVLVAAGAVPPGLVVPARPQSALLPGSRFINPWGGEVSLTIGRTQPGWETRLMVVTTDIPNAVCTRLATSSGRQNAVTDRVVRTHYGHMDPVTKGGLVSSTNRPDISPSDTISSGFQLPMCDSPDGVVDLGLTVEL